MSELSLMLNRVNPVRSPMDSGIIPVKRFPPMKSLERFFGRLPIDTGITPSKRFPSNARKLSLELLLKDLMKLSRF